MTRVKEHRAAGFFGRSVEIILLAAFIAAAVFAVLTKWLVPVKVEGNSMSPSLREGEVVIADRFFQYGRGLKRGDLVAVRDSEDSLFIRRIAALPGETADIVEGKLYIDGCPVEEPYIVTFFDEVSMEPYTVPQGAYLILSDDRRNTLDSRSETIGPVLQEDVWGLIRFRILPADRMNIFR